MLGDRYVVPMPIMRRCKVKMTKRSVLLLAAVLAVASTSALADQTAADKAAAPTSKSVVLSDAELDSITAGAAIVGTVVFNNGNASVFRATDSRVQCINCAELEGAGISKAIIVINPARTVFRCVGVGCP
jgi:hypothetical protein